MSYHKQFLEESMMFSRLRHAVWCYVVWVRLKTHLLKASYCFRHLICRSLELLDSLAQLITFLLAYLIQP
jgi:hypothetical protein